eukprot:gene317-6731_t
MKKAQKSEVAKGDKKNIEVEEESNDQIQEEPTENEYVCNSNEAMNFKLISTIEDLDKNDISFHPTYTHQIFGEDERIVGFKNLKINIYFHASTLNTCIEQSYDEKIVKDINPISLLTKKPIEFEINGTKSIPFRYETLSNLNEFKKIIKKKKTIKPTTFGNEIERYEKNERIFEIYLGDFENPNIIDYHERLQIFSLFFIQGASYINNEDSKWKIFLIFEKIKDIQVYNIVGYCTVYPFYGYPDRTRLRISQFIILPPFQKQGHGSKLLKSIYNYAKQINSIDVCVEDPSDDFQSLRDKIDFQNFQKLNLNLNEFNKELKDRVKNELKINDSQIRKCYEIEKLNQILNSKEKNEEKKRKLELEIKRRLFKEYDLNNYFEDKKECKSNLDSIYKEVYQEYIDILKK